MSEASYEVKLINYGEKRKKKQTIKNEIKKEQTNYCDIIYDSIEREKEREEGHFQHFILFLSYFAFTHVDKSPAGINVSTVRSVIVFDFHSGHYSNIYGTSQKIVNTTNESQ